MTSTVIDSGAVMLYIATNIGAHDGWLAMSWTYLVASNTLSRTYNYMYFPKDSDHLLGGLLVIAIEQSESLNLWTYTTTNNFKLVSIPPAQHKAHPNVDLNSYDEVKATYHLMD